MAGKNNALQKPVNLSPELENVVGKGPKEQISMFKMTGAVSKHMS